MGRDSQRANVVIVRPTLKCCESVAVEPPSSAGPGTGELDASVAGTTEHWLMFCYLRLPERSLILYLCRISGEQFG